MCGKNNISDRNKAEIERLSKLNVMQEIRRQALDIQVRLMDSDINVVSGAEKDLEQLLGRFYDENINMMAPQQYEAAKKDFGYFLVLIETAVEYYDQEGYDMDTVH